MKLLMNYLKRQYKLIALLAVFSVIFAAVFSLYDLPGEAVGYAVILCLLCGGLVFIASFGAYMSRHKKIQRLLRNVEEAAFQLPFPNGALEEDYQILVKKVAEDRNRIAAEEENNRREMLDYYTLWAHQIKTPIAAMHLLLQKENIEREALNAELFKIEEYVEMVLSYLRLGSDSTDYVLRTHDLDEIVRSCLRKYARLFILKKLSLEYEGIHRTVVTDEKWMGFVIGQIFSNAVKYTPEGGSIRIFDDGDVLTVADTGIGIRQEDLPRVFEKGFTGYNGRENQKSSGIGLYLCRQVTKRLGAQILISSKLGQGTAVQLKMPKEMSMME